MTEREHGWRAFGPDSGVGSTNISDNERFLSVVGGGAAVLLGLARRGVPGAALALGGAYLVYRGTSGHSPLYGALNVQSTHEGGVKVRKTMTINRPVEEVYNFWHNFENLPRFMKHLQEVRVMDNGRSHWVATSPTGTVEWDAEITADRPNETIGWRSLPDSQINTVGGVHFRPAPGDRGTEVQVSLVYEPPAGAAGALIAKLFGEEPTLQVTEDLRRFKSLMEAGEIPTIEGQTHGERSMVGKALAGVL